LISWPTLSVAAERPLNWNVMTVNASNIAECQAKLEAGDYARARGGRVVALTVPMSFPDPGSRSGPASYSTRMPEWEHAMLLAARREARAVSATGKRSHT